ncbi:MAG: DNA/RNA non-specific endonuclease [Bacteroides sp.]|nr:DNA/RNA non-specific endonuclease [Roseburia sp.]MCM1346999.1 DNA/RNA non-specific endonuclease [Bacteroides sp.]MCM1421551.1 DNA/RNA non-specific endonuclease [Bacteroides sp.]
MKKKIYRLIFFITLATAVSAVASCEDEGEDYQLGGGNGGYAANPNYLERIEVPAMKNSGTIFVQHSTKVGSDSVMTYCLEYDKNLYHSCWVAFRFDGNTRNKTVSRSDEPFTDDPKIASDLKIGNRGFGGIYNRGHLCASADRLYGREANEQTFYMTNMSPQINSFNQGYWITLEEFVQNKGRDANFADTLYVCKGGTIYDNKILGYVTRTNGNKVPVPKYYFMALLRVKNGTYSSIAFYMEHKEYGYTYQKHVPMSEMAKNVVTVDELEELTGIDFFHNLPNTIESAVERQYSLSVWGLN